MNGGCRYCGQDCGEREFCDETCYQEHKDEVQRQAEEIAEEWPGEAVFHNFDEPDVWDVVGGL